MSKRWLLLAVRVINRLGAHSTGDMAASVSYYSFLSIFPLLVGIISILGFIFPSQLVQSELFSFFEEHLPTSVGILRDNISAIIRMRGTLGILSLVGLFWSGGALFASISRVANRAWGISVYRPYFIRKIRDLTVAVGTGFIFFISLGLTAISAVLPAITLPIGITVSAFISQVIAFILIFSIFLLIYKYIPNTKIAWRDIWAVALFGAVIFEVINSAFSFYLAHFAKYQLVYGSIASVIAFVVWIYFSSFILIVGFELCAEYTKMRKEGISIEEHKSKTS
jgi:membrane protein